MTEKENPVNHPQQNAQWAMLAFEHAYDPIFVHKRNLTGLSGQFVAVNEAACRRLGYTKEELLALSPQDIAVPKAVSMYPRIKETATKQGEVVFESVQVTKDGKKIPVENSAYLLDVDGETMVINISRDISERKKAHDELEQKVKKRTAELEKAGEALQSSAHQWQSTFDSIADAVSILTPDFEILRCNEAMVAFVGKPRDQIVGRTCWNVVHGTSKPIENCPVIRLKETLRRETATFLMKDRWISVAVDPILDIGGKLIGAVHIVADINESKQVEEAVRKERDRAQQYLDVAGTIFAAVNTKGEVNLINKKGCELLGYKEYEIIGKNWFENYIPERIRAETILISKKLLAGEIELAEYHENPVLTRSGEERLIAWHNTIIKDDAGRIIGHLSSGEDITERKQAEEEIRKLSNAVEQSIDGVAISDLEAKLVFVNQAFAQIHGYTVEEMLGMKVESIHSKEQQREFKRRIVQIMEKGSWTGEIGHMKKDGSTFPTFMTTTLLKDQQGSPVGILVSVHDITERKKAEEALHASEVKYENLVEQGNDGIIIIQNNLLRFLNSKMAEMAGYTCDELLDKSFIELVAPRYRELVVDIYKQRMAGIYVSSDYEIAILRKDGTEMSVEVNASLTEYEGAPADMAIIRDITERKQAADQLKQYSENLENMVVERAQELADSEEKFRLIVNSTNDAIYVSQRGEDEQVRIIEINQTISEMLGYSRQEMRQMHPRELVSAKGLEMNMEKLKLLDEQKHVVYESEFSAKGGKKIPVEVSARLFMYKGIRTIVSVIRDISERKQSERMLDDTQQRLVRAEKLAAIGQLASGIAHELRNPLAVINNAAYYLKMRMGGEDKSVDKHLGIMEREVFRSSGIIAGLLDFARTREPRLEQVELSSFVGEIISKLSMPKGIKLFFDNQAKDTKMAIDAEQIKRVLLNLISNAIQAMQSGGELSIQLRLNDGYIDIDVSDTGLGIEQKYRSRIFEPLFTTRAEKGGTGIGLSICKSIVDAHHGAIKLKSQVGEGTTFTVKMPIKQI